MSTMTQAEVQLSIDRCLKFIKNWESYRDAEIGKFNEQVTAGTMYRSDANKKIAERTADYNAAIHQMRIEMAKLLAIKTTD